MNLKKLMKKINDAIREQKEVHGIDIRGYTVVTIEAPKQQEIEIVVIHDAHTVTICGQS